MDSTPVDLPPSRTKCVENRRHCRGRGVFHGGVGFVHHLHVFAADGRQFSCYAAADERGDHVLFGKPRDFHPDQRLGRRPLRRTQGLLRGDRVFHLGLRAVWAVRFALDVGGQPHRARFRRRHDDACRPAYPDAYLSQERAHAGDELFHAAGDVWSGRGAVGRRLHHHLFFLALEFLHQRPAGVLGIAFAIRFIPDIKMPPPAAFDVPGFIIIAAGLGTAQIAIENLGRQRFRRRAKRA